MKKIIVILLAIVMCFCLKTAAQTVVVSGLVVSSEDHLPLPGVGVMISSTASNSTSTREHSSPIGTITDLDGAFSIECSQGDILTFSAIGFIEHRYTVPSPVNLRSITHNVTMQVENTLLEETIVVAYGTRKKGTIAGSVSAVKSDKIADVPAAGFDQALQGQTPGLTVLSSSGEPSKAATFQIRGTNSINSGTSPLFILDGVQISSSDFNAISPGDIESVSILKDASSSSIYGARAANGVVVITTKRGTRQDKAQISFRSQGGFSQIAHGRWNLMNTDERIRFEKEIGLDAGQNYDILSKTDINWLETVFNRHAPLQSYELSASRGTENFNYYLSGGFFDQDGIAQGSSFKRYSFRSNVDAKMGANLRVGGNTMLTFERVEQAEEGSYALYTPISASRFMLPYWDPYRKDGSIASESDGSWKGTSANPLEWMANNPQIGKKIKLINTLFAEADLAKDLKWKTQAGVDFTGSATFMQSFPSYSGNGGSGAAGRASYHDVTLSITNTLNYELRKGIDHSLSFMLGQEGVDFIAEGFQAIAVGQCNDLLTDLSSGTRVSSWSDSFSSHSYLSFFSRAEYSYAGRWYADLSLRADASSRFGKGSRWAGFWSTGIMWNLRGESFFKELRSIFTDARLTFSTGTSGNSSIPDYDHMALVSGGSNYLGGAGIYPSQSGNEDLSWEKLWTTNAGAHIGILERVGLDFEAYHKKTTDMLMAVPVSYSSSGEGYRWDNVGEMINRGVEISVNADVLSAGDFRWNLNCNFSYNHNEITELYNNLNEYEVSTTGTKLVVGHSVGEFYLNRYAGVNPANGDALWLTADGSITTEYRQSDKVMIGKSYIAPWQGGFGTTIAWKGFTLSAQAAWVADRWVFNNDRFFEESNGLYSAYNQSRRLLHDRWRAPGDITDIPRYGVTPQMDSRFLENASFLRLKNLTLAYRIPTDGSKLVSGARFYLQGQNLLTLTSFSGLDPENTSNIYAAQYPASRQFTAGIEINF